jgi:hypothetical protein
MTYAAFEEPDITYVDVFTDLFIQIIGGAGGVTLTQTEVRDAVIDAINLSTDIEDLKTSLLALATLTDTQPVSVASLPLPTGASTAAKQPAFGVAGTPSADVITVQGSPSGIAQPVSMVSLPALATGSNAIGSITNSAFGISGTLPSFASIPTFNIGTAPDIVLGAGSANIGAITNTAFGISGTLPAFASAPTVNLGTLNGAATSALQTQISGQLPTTLGQKTSANSLSVVLSSDSASVGGGISQAQTRDAVSDGLDQSVDIEAIKTNTARLPAQGQALAAASLPVVLTAAQESLLTPPAAITGFALDTSVNSLLKPASTLAAVTTLGSITNPLPAGTNALGSITNTAFGISGTLPAFAATPTFNIGTAPAIQLSTGANAIGSITNTAFGISGNLPAFAATPTVNIGVAAISRYRNTALSATKQEIKAAAGDIYGWNLINPNTVDVYVKFYDSAVGGVTVGTTAPAFTLMVPAASTAGSGLFFQDVLVMPQERFTTGITIACVTGIADNSTAAPATAIHASVRFI